jgi:hypothetical protein
MKCGNKLMRFGYKVTRMLYGGFIFYFTPFVVLVLPFFTLAIE